MNTEISVPISKEEIDWVRAKHAGIQKAARRILKEAMEIGQWFMDADKRMGLKKGPGRGGEWNLWLGATFPEMHVRIIANYMRLARGRDFLEQELNEIPKFGINSQFPLTITGALRLLRDHDRQQKEDQEPNLSPAEFEEPLLILRDQLKSYVYQQFQLQYQAEQIRFRIKNAKLGRRQIRQAVEWATQEHLEVRETVLMTFLDAAGRRRTSTT